ncbi:MAG: ccpA 2 [Clostridiales bacterium]|nr:ccpA 2 [Clostridiales bacterium]
MVTINDVAREAGVSLATVSRVINNKGNVSAPVKEKVESIIKDLGYIPNNAARALVNKSTNSIGVIVNNLHDPFFCDLIKGFEHGANKTSYNIIFCSVLGGDVELKERYIKYLTNGVVDAVVLYGSYFSDERIINYIRDADINYVLIENDIENLHCNKLLIDNYNGSKNAVEYLISMGHKDIAYICGNPNKKVSIERLNGYIHTMQTSNLNIADGFIQYTSSGNHHGYENMKLLMNLEKKKPTAVFCGDDAIAFNAITAALEMGLRVPEDVSIMGFDNQSVLPNGYKGPSITTMAQPLYQIGMDSIQLLVDQLDNKISPDKINKVYKTNLVQGKTVECRN